MKLSLVGSTGFVGGNLAASHPFDGLYHSTDIAQAFGTKPDILFYAGVPAAKYLANADPAADLAQIETAAQNIRAIEPKRVVLISTVDVYAAPCGVDENIPPDADNPAAYGRNRTLLEQRVRAMDANALIVRLPALFGRGLKKNFIYDFITRTPAMLTQEKYEELAAQSELVRQAYAPAKNGFYAVQQQADRAALRTYFTTSKFNALAFTDSRASFQFYDLSNLWRDLSVALAANISLLNLATPPVTAAEVYACLTHGEVFCNECAAQPPSYDMRSKYAALYGGPDGYLYEKEAVLEALAAFVRAAQHAEETR